MSGNAALVIAVFILNRHRRVWFRPAQKVVSSGVLPGIVGAIQANETIKIILGAEDILVNRLLLFDAWAMKFREFKLRKDPKCLCVVKARLSKN
mgnify:CR=1 FL=1